MNRELDRRSFSSSNRADAELVLGVVAPVGTDVDFVERCLAERLKHFGYVLVQIRVSKLIAEFDGLKEPLYEEPLYQRLVSHMNAGNELRERHNRTDILALAAVREIQRCRRERVQDGPAPRVVYFVRSLKHPDEVRTLREVYGRGFFLLGVSSSRKDRLDNLVQHKAVAPSDAERLLERDQSEAQGHGQQTRDSFHLADAFIALGDKEADNSGQLWRLADLLFGQPFITPTMAEYSMFLAYSASLRSADLSRQVGSVIVTSEGDVLATGANDVPAPDGNIYWSSGYADWPQKPSNDKRDWVLGYDSNRKRRDEIALEVAGLVQNAEHDRVCKIVARHLSHLGDKELLEKINSQITDPAVEPQNALSTLSKSKLMDLTEFGRAVHAEMDALMACTRVGVKAKGATLFCTTFPCHNCTKHIIASGIREVVYIEPYPKSLASELYPEAVDVLSSGEVLSSEVGASQQKTHRKVIFRPFTGIGPRKYLDLFSLSLSTGRTVDRRTAASGSWYRSQTSLRVSMVPSNYLELEDAALDVLNQATESTS